MAEALVVATKRREGRNEEDGETLFVNLYHRPGSIRETVGTYPRRLCGSARNDAGGYRPRSAERTLRLPRGNAAPLATTRLGDLGEKGLLHRDISGKNSNGTPRGPFDIIPIQGVPEYPVLWEHEAERERRLVVPPDSEGERRGFPPEHLRGRYCNLRREWLSYIDAA